MKRERIRAGVFLIVAIVFCLFASISFGDGAIPVFVSEDGALVLTTSASYAGLALVNTETGKSIPVTDGANAGYYATISPDNRYVCFKGFKQGAHGLLQAPQVYDIGKKQTIALSDWAPLAGTPAVAHDGTIAFTVGDDLIVLDADLNALGTFDLGHHVNLVAISPDGAKVAFNDKNDQIVVIARADGKRQAVGETQSSIGSGENAYWGPKFSPLGDKVLASTVGGTVVCAELKRATFKSLGTGEAAGWVNNDTIAFVKKTIQAERVAQCDIISVSASGTPKGRAVLNTGDATAVINGSNIVSAHEGKIKAGILDKGEPHWLGDIAAPFSVAAGFMPAPGRAAPSDTTVQISGVPYIHQVYDTLDTFCGSWACGASSALMAIQFYNILPEEPRNVSYPYPHVSPYGFYVSEIYTYNAHTYNLAADDSCGRTAYGGYGYIVQNNWENTKTHMAEYISYHGPTSSVDWSPTFAKAQGEVNNSHPFVLLNSLTTSGHYITCVGYYTAQYTLIFNDPYGNKNTPGYPSYDGTGACYDWPGYNYGNQNLNTVWCYIYCRMTAVTPTPTPSPTPSATPSPTPTASPTPTPTPTPTATPTPNPTPTPSPRVRGTSMTLR